MMLVFEIPDDIKNKKVEDIGFHPETLEYLQAHGYMTVREVVEKKDNIETKYLTNIKAKLIFNLDLTPK